MNLKNFTLLYVEDDMQAQEHMKMLLEDDFKAFYQAFDAKEAFDIYKEKKPDIILSDIILPSTDGLTLSKEIKKTDKWQPIIILSAFDEREKLLEAIDTGIDYFIPKPVDIEMLYDRLHTIARNLQNDIDAKKTKEKELEVLYALAHYDTLTQVANRHLFSVKLNETINKAQHSHENFTLFFIDLDNFKSINDQYGHSAGDAVLQSVAQNIKKVIRIEDTFARIGGDEFALIIENMKNTSDINTLANKIIHSVATPIVFQKHTFHITCSIGIAVYPTQGNSQEALLHSADMAMYAAKKDAKSRFKFSDSSTAPVTGGQNLDV
ncbi:GGDEF domain-containing response regulator [Sulfurimonas sp. SWIR-19]|uniref:two-component system response regulator n=1 Tax=Sulfurimonas sp. SWIR-19 TaxID=2878390 RepID=UPI001CF3B643|nr:GGDEF domain-containing response regulator [Sulfurimonas sp. SWIR-19]UCN00249.1 GGDEF domain-containing response regulator [Sulfurimonas sp. SWIR-19]